MGSLSKSGKPCAEFGREHLPCLNRFAEPIRQIDRSDGGKKMPWEAGMWRDLLNDFNGKMPICLGSFAVILVEMDDFGGENHRAHWPL